MKSIGRALAVEANLSDKKNSCMTGRKSSPSLEVTAWSNYRHSLRNNLSRLSVRRKQVSLFTCILQPCNGWQERVLSQAIRSEVVCESVGDSGFQNWRSGFRHAPRPQSEMRKILRQRNKYLAG